MILSFEPRDDPPGLDIVDHVERRQCKIHSKNSLSPQEAPLDEFYFPVDRGKAITADQLSIPHFVLAYVRNREGWMVSELAEGDSRDFPEDRYSVEITAPIKLYLVFEASFSVSATGNGITFNLNEDSEILVGARSHHKHPAASITTTEDPRDMMEAISYLGSALKTTTCERSYPTLRGHPPTIEVGLESQIPQVLERPKTGLHLELPTDLQSVFIASTLAYYLGADVKPGGEPRLITESGFEHTLDDPVRGFGGEIERVLKQTFFLDCITRTEGYYPVELHERSQLEDRINLDFELLYEQPLESQIEAYLDVPYSIIEPHVPKWKLTAHVVSDPNHIEMIPFVVDDLAVIRTGSNFNLKETSTTGTGLDEFMRRGEFTRGMSRSDAESSLSPNFIELGEVESLEQTWIGDGMPIGASKAMLEAYINRLKREPADGDIDITVVCNDMAMEGEGNVVDEVYGSRDELPFDVNIHKELTTHELRYVFRRDTDFLHYIGHIDSEGFECADGKFDVCNLDYTGVDAFFLNACTSYQQGIHLIEAGSIAGVVTLQDVINSGAERVGETLARLLNQGFPLHAALQIAKSRSIMGGHYLIIGDGGLDIAQTEGGVPSMCEIESIGESTFRVKWKTYPTRSKSIGTITVPFIGENQENFLSSGNTGIFDVNQEELFKFLSYELIPIEFDGEFYWSGDLIDNLTTGVH